MTEEVNKPFWGPHRILQTLSLLRSVLTTVALSAVLWATDSNIWDYDRVNSQVAAGLVLPFNWIYYIYQHADMPFGCKVVLQTSNILFSTWLMVVVFANIPRLALVMHDERRPTQYGCVFGIIYLSYAFCY